MRILALESSTDALSVAAGDGVSWHALGERGMQAHSQRVLPLCDRVLAEAGWTYAQLDGIAFGAGPGAFTGVRMACGIAQGLALGASLPLVPVSTLSALAQEAWRASGATRVFACLDARMREVYVAALQREGSGWRECVEAATAKPADVTVPQGRWYGAGDGFAAYPALAALPFDGVDAAIVPTARAVAELALPILAAGGGLAPEDAQPRYVRQRVALTAAQRAAGETL